MKRSRRTMEFRARLDFSDITILDSSLYRQGNWWGFPSGASGKEFTCLCRRHEMRIGSLGREDPLEKGMASHSRFLALEIPWAEEPGGLQSLGSHRVGPD